jgi:hypothetical protein
MKTKTKLIGMLLLTVMLTVSIANAQEKESYGMAEITYMMPKIGMEKTFENAIKAHNQKYHKENPYKASLDLILTGKETGWYVWIMGPCTFSDLDNRPNDPAHAADWDKTVSPTVAKYGRNEFWRYNSKLSYKGDASESPKFENIWFVDVERGQGYKFNEFIEKVKKAYEKKGSGNFSVYNNQFTEGNGRDIAIVWAFDKWADMDEDDGGIKSSFEEIYGEGSWDNALKDWEASTVNINSQVWRIGVNK